ncbi:MAG: cob(I)yrinic acid a,c-diamide adenosyltransferase [Clostridiales bacterium]
MLRENEACRTKEVGYDGGESTWFNLRAAGCGYKTTIIQFMKPGSGCGELNALQMIPQISVYSYGLAKFLIKGQTPDSQSISLAQQGMTHARKVMAEQSADILILDELNNAIFFDLVTEEEALVLMKEKPKTMELVLTGRNATTAVINAADLVTEMREIKYPHDLQMTARRGIEY